MREISKKEIKTVKKLLMKIPFRTGSLNKSVLFFPLEGEDLKEKAASDMLILTEKQDFGSNAFLKPGLILSKTVDKKTFEGISLGYVTTEYAKEFNLEEYLEIVSDLSSKDIEKLKEFKCYLVKIDYIVSDILF